MTLTNEFTLMALESSHTAAGFENAKDYAAFEKVFEEAREQVPIRVLAFCLMRNHWHLMLWPLGDGDLSDYMCWLTHTHTRGTPFGASDWQQRTADASSNSREEIAHWACVLPLGRYEKEGKVVCFPPTSDGDDG